MILSFSLVAATVAAYVFAALRFTTHGTGKHAAETVKMWPLTVRGAHADAPVTETVTLAPAVA